jgi:uncharacterized protein (TIGR00255 family)
MSCVPVEFSVSVGREADRVIHSMTGYGRAEVRFQGMPLVVEVRSVNHRHCEVVTRLPRPLQAYEDGIKSSVQAHVRRGRVDVGVTFNGSPDAGARRLQLDRRLARQYVSLLRVLQREFKVPGAVDLTLLAGFREIISSTEDVADVRGVAAATQRALKKALQALMAMRRQEGRALEQDLSARLAEVERRMTAIHARLPQIIEEHFGRLQARLNRLLEGLPGGRDRIDPVRVSQEVALLADRSDISEELTRMHSHLQQFRQFLRKSEPVGRSMDFLLQEMNREVTTIASKVGDLSVTQDIIATKAELEKIREQVQNVE